MIFPIIFLHFGVTVISGCEYRGEKYISGSNTDVTQAMEFLESSNILSVRMANKFSTAVWNYRSNLTEHNKNNYLKMTEEMAKFKKDTWKKATSFAWKKYKNKNDTMYRWFKTLSILGTVSLSSESYDKYQHILTNMQAIHSKAKICPYLSSVEEPCDQPLNPDLVEVMKSSTNYDELKYVWKSWRDETGRKIKKNFLKYVEYSNEAACLNGFSNTGEMWLEEFESENIIKEFDYLWKTIKPLYQQLHAYVRKKLIDVYSMQYIKPYGPIPAHILGNMWAQSWENIYKLVAPYPNKSTDDVTNIMKEKEVNPLGMFKISEEFFTSLGLKKMTPEFWNKSIIEKPPNTEMICQPSAMDFFKNGDVRIRMCADVNIGNLIIIHHEMGHIEYFLHYQHQPVVFRNGANSGFHEAIGDVMTLSVSHPDHMKKIGLLKEVLHDKESEINHLMEVALIKVVFIPFAFSMDLWRWKIFDGSIRKDELNTQWWNLRLKYQGICPPVTRTEDDLDAASKFHVAGNVPYIRYFVSFVIQFQFQKALCEEAGHKGPLHKCDIYNNKKAGKLLSKMLRLGSSVSWQDAMKVITKGKTNKMDATAFLEYFQPLYDWLKEENSDNIIGWYSDTPTLCLQ